MKSIALAEQFFKPVKSGKKKITIRENYRNYRLGSAEFYNPINESNKISIDIRSIRYSKIKDLTERECQADGAQDQEKMLEILNRFYELDMDSIVNVVEFEAING